MDSIEKIIQLENLNITLNEEIKSLRSQIEKQDLIEKKYEESQERFRVIFEQSKFGNKNYQFAPKDYSSK